MATTAAIRTYLVNKLSAISTENITAWLPPTADVAECQLMIITSKQLLQWKMRIQLHNAHTYNSSNIYHGPHAMGCIVISFALN